MASVVLPPELARLTERAVSAKARPDDVEAVHQLRVATRRVRSLAVEVAEGLGPSAGDLVEALAEAQRRLGALRDADVLGQRLESLPGLLPPWWAGRGAPAEPGGARAGPQVTAHLSPEERRALVIGAAEAADEVGRQLGGLLERTPGSADELRRARRLARGCLARLAGRLEQRMAPVGSGPVALAWACPAGEGRSLAHRARIAAKRYRYVLDAFSAAGLVEARPSLSAALADLQDALGLGLDARRSQPALAEVVAAGSTEQALAAVAWALSANDAVHADREAALAWKLVEAVGSAVTWS